MQRLLPVAAKSRTNGLWPLAVIRVRKPGHRHRPLSIVQPTLLEGVMRPDPRQATFSRLALPNDRCLPVRRVTTDPKEPFDTSDLTT